MNERSNSMVQGVLVSNPRTLALVALIWTIVSVITTTTAFIAVRGDSLSQWFAIFRPMLLYYSVWVVISLLVYRAVEWSTSGRVSWPAGAAAHLLLLVAVALALPFIVHFDNWRAWLYGERAPGFHTLAVVIYALNVVGSLLIHFYRLSVTRDREAREARLKSSLLENQLNLARMDALKMQINPHFLFNALNSIAALIETERNPEAYHATELLGSLLRQSLDQSTERFLPLDKEIEFARRYVNVEKVRFGSRISFEEAVDSGCSACELPALLLQPLIENSVKHAVGKSSGPISIRLAASRDGERLRLELTDDGPGLPPGDGGREGYGLANVRKRLELLYGESATLDVANRKARGVRVGLSLPCRAPHS